MARDIEVGGIAVQQKLDPILWQGETWAVTEYGIERLDGSRWLPAERITDGYRGAGRYLRTSRRRARASTRRTFP